MNKNKKKYVTKEQLKDFFKICFISLVFASISFFNYYNFIIYDNWLGLINGFVMAILTIILLVMAFSTLEDDY